MKHKPARHLFGGPLPALFAAGLTLWMLACGCGKELEPADYVKQLASPNADVRSRAVEELTRMQKMAIGAVRAGLKSPEKNVRIGCIQVLARLRRTDVLTQVGELVQDPDRDVRLEAIKAVSTLSGVWKQKGVELLSKALDGDDPACIQAAAEGLKGIGTRAAAGALRRKLREGKGMQAVYAARMLYEMQSDPEAARLLLSALGGLLGKK